MLQRNSSPSPCRAFQRSFSPPGLSLLASPSPLPFSLSLSLFSVSLLSFFLFALPLYLLSPVFGWFCTFTLLIHVEPHIIISSRGHRPARTHAHTHTATTLVFLALRSRSLAPSPARSAPQIPTSHLQFLCRCVANNTICARMYVVVGSSLRKSNQHRALLLLAHSPLHNTHFHYYSRRSSSSTLHYTHTPV